MNNRRFGQSQLWDGVWGASEQPSQVGYLVKFL